MNKRLGTSALPGNSKCPLSSGLFAHSPLAVNSHLRMHVRKGELLAADKREAMIAMLQRREMRWAGSI